jgi:small-conductance mechanosensitive channel
MSDSPEILASLWSGARPWAESLVVLGVGFGIGLLALLVAGLVLKHGVRRGNPALADSLRSHCAGVAGWFLPLLGVYLALPLSGPAAEQPWLTPLLVSALIFGIGMLLVRLVRVLEDTISRRVQMDVADNLRARKFHTQFRILRQVLTLIIWLLTLSAILLQFDGFRQFGRGLLASAGIASLVIGFAAQRTLGNLIAGFQIAITQPIRLDDVVVVGERVGTDRGDHPQLRGGENLGRPAPRAPDQLFPGESLHQLDTPHGRDPRHRVPARGLQRPAGRAAH